LSTENIQFEEFREATMLTATSTGLKQNDLSRIGRIREVINTKGLNTEKLNSLRKVITEFPDIFHLGGDSFPSTNAIQHEIRLKEDAKPVNIRPYRLPQNLISDQGTEFLDKIFAETCKLLGIKRIHTSPYYLQVNGKLERSHRTLGEY